MECVTCKQFLPDGVDICPRCGADNGHWRALRAQPGWQQWLTFFDHTLAAHVLWILVLLAAIVMLGAAPFSKNNRDSWVMGAIAAFNLTTLFYLGAYILRWRAREYEWLRRELKNWRPSTSQLAFFGSTAAVLLILLAALLPTSVQDPPRGQRIPPLRPAVAWGVASLAGLGPGALVAAVPDAAPLPQAQSNQVTQQGLRHPAAPVLLGLALGLFGFSFALLADLTFVNWLNQQLPRPIFADRARMARVIRREAEILLEAGQKNRQWDAETAHVDTMPETDGSLERGETWEQDYRRAVPARNMQQGLWEIGDCQEEVRTLHRRYKRLADSSVNDFWTAWEQRPTIEVHIQQIRRTDNAGVRVQLEVASGESQKQMKQGKDLVHLRLREARHFELHADEWGWPVDLREVDDYRLVQIIGKDIPVIEPPTPLALPKSQG